MNAIVIEELATKTQRVKYIYKGNMHCIMKKNALGHVISPHTPS